MFIKNVLMDANEGLYIDLSDIWKRLNNIKFPDTDPDIDPVPDPEKPEIDPTTADFILLNEIDLGTTATFKAWRSCYYVEETSVVVGKNTYETYLPYKHIYINSTISGVPLESGINCCTSYTQTEINGTIKFVPNNSTLGFTVSSDPTETLSFSSWSGWVDAKGNINTTTPDMQFSLIKTTQEDVKTSKFTRILTDDIIYYTLAEPDSGKDYIENYINSNKQEGGKVLTKSTATTFSETGTTYPDLSSIQYSNLSPKVLGCIKENTFYQPTNLYTYIDFDDHRNPTEYDIYLGTVYYQGGWYNYKSLDGKSNAYVIGSDGYAVPSQSVLTVDSSSIFLSIEPELVVKAFIKSFLSGEEYIDPYSRDSSTNSDIKYPSYQLYAAANNTVSYPDTLVAFLKTYDALSMTVESNYQKIGYGDSISYQNYTFAGLSKYAPQPVYMEGTDGNMYLVAQTTQEYNTTTDNYQTVAAPVHSSYYYTHTFTPFETYTRTDGTSLSLLTAYGGFVRDPSKDKRVKLTGIIHQNDTYSTLSDYFTKIFNKYGETEMPTIEWDSVK